MSELPQGWVETTLGEAGFWCSGGTPSRKNPEYFGEGIPWIKSGDLTDGLITKVEEQITQKGLENSSAKLIPEGAISIAMYGATVGKLGIFTFPAATNQACANVVPNQNLLNTKYLFYYLCSEKSSLIEKGKGGAQPNISQEIIKSHPLLIAPLSEQRRIVAKLEKLLAKCEASKQRLDKIPGILKRFRQSILATACSGRLTADWREQNPDVEPASELLKRVQEEKHYRYEKEYNEAVSKGLKKPKKPIFSDIENYEIDTWNSITLETVAEAIVDCPHSTPKWTDSGFVCARTTQFEPFNLKLDDVKYVGEKTFKERTSRLKPQAGDVLYSREGGILGIACQIPAGLELCLGQRMMLVRCNSDWLSGEYLAMLLNSEVILSQVKELITGTASPHLNVGDVKAFRIPIPPLAEQKEIIQRVEKLLKLADQIEQRYQKARAYVDKLPQSILAKAFQGELVPQDPNDEPASVLLDRIHVERTQQKSKGSRRKGENLSD